MLKKSTLKKMKKIVGKENLLSSEEHLKAYSYDGTTNWISKPEVVVFPNYVQQVADIVKIANEDNIPITPRGGGTNVSGGSVPIMGGIVLCTTKMNRIIKIDKENLSATVECGLVLEDFSISLENNGLFFPPDPQSYLAATIGGIIAENAGGPACVKYGVTKQYVLGIEVVLPTGDVVNLGGRTIKNVVGYDLLHLFISSEGTLGIITKAELKLRPLPEARRTAMVIFNDVAVAGENVSRVLEKGVIPCKIELLDNWVINSIENVYPIGLPREADAVLLFEVDGIAEVVEKDIQEITRIVKENGAYEIRVAENEDESNRYWKARRSGFAAVYGKAKTVLAEDVTVPRGKIPDLIKKCKEIAREFKIEITVLGHAGDGNLHPSILTDINNAEHYLKATKALDIIIEETINLGGVLSGEHGIGLEKQKFFSRLTDPIVVNMMKDIKKLFDPNDIMNPGKIWDKEG